MTLFDRVLQPDIATDATLSPQAAVAAVLIAAAAADGHVTPPELARIDNALASMKLFRAQTPQRLSGLAAAMTDRLGQEGARQVLGEAAAVLPAELRATAFTLAVDLVLADGTAEVAEKAFVDLLQTVLGIDEAFALRVVEVMLVKNGG